MPHKPLLKKPLAPNQCQFCGATFQPYRDTQIYCPQPTPCRTLSNLMGSPQGRRLLDRLLAEDQTRFSPELRKKLALLR